MERPLVTSSRPLAGVFALCFLVVVAACSDNQDPPTSATVIVEASPGQPLLLIVSTRFEVVASGEIVYTNQDTIEVTENYTEKFALNSEARFTAILKNDVESEEEVRLAVFIDEGLEYDERATLGQNGFLQYVYRFQFGAIF